jgi:Na+-translocating ferredoxin:NAD+ oxidoreductase RnfG subunit
MVTRLLRTGRLLLMQGLRGALLAGIFWLMQLQQLQLTAARRSQGLDHVPLSTVQALFPAATSLGVPTANGGREVLSGDDRIGTILQTFPEAERFLGFSGPTNLLIGLNRKDAIVGLHILSSADTRDHVELIRKDKTFLHALNGHPVQNAPVSQVDAVTGATLTSLAILQGLQARLGRQSGSLKFPDAYTLEDARRLFPTAATIRQDSVTPELWHVDDAAGNPVGSLLSNSPAADNIVGFQGPTQAFLGMSVDGKIVGLVIQHSYDNEPYVGYARQDAWFSELFNGQTANDLAALDGDTAGIEGVSGATMTSQAVARGLLLSARDWMAAREQAAQAQTLQAGSHRKALLTIAILAGGFVLGMTRLRGQMVLRRLWQVTVILLLGFWNGELLSMAMFTGWARYGIPWQNALGLVCLAVAALAVPFFTRQNLYCDHLCPHGALQQLLPRRWKLSHRPRWLIALLRPVRVVLLLVVVLVPLLNWNFSLVDLEPFDAYLWNAAGWPAIVIAAGGLTASLFLPMGYCHYGCPTGAVLGFLRRHARSDRMGKADAVAAGLFLVALLCYWLA